MSFIELFAKAPFPVGYLRHGGDVGPERLGAFVRRFARGTFHLHREPVDDAYVEKWVRQATAEGAHGFLPTWRHRLPVVSGTGVVLGHRDLGVIYKLAYSPFELNRQVRLRIPVMEAEPDHWAILWGDTGLRFDDAEGMAWFADRFRDFADFLHADFAFAGSVLAVHVSAGEDVTQLAWPLMVFGPDRVARLGRERVLSAPAARVDALPYGGFCLQAAANPFVATPQDVERVARHLGMPLPSG